MSQQIYDLIRANVDASAAYDANDDQGVVDALAAETTEIRDPVPKTSRHLILTMGDADARLMLGTMRTVAELDPLMASMWTAFATTGINFAEDQTQANITVLAAAGVWPDALTQKVREFGVYSLPTFETAMGRPPTLADVTQTRFDQTATPDATEHEVLLSANRRADGTLNVLVRITQVNLSDGRVIRKDKPQNTSNDPDTVAALETLIEGLING